MHIATCIVRLAGNKDMEVPKSDVTPAEVIILRAMHGDDAVVSIKPTGDIVRSHSEEKARLALVYRAKMPDEASPDKTYLDHLFPGFDPRMPTDFRELRLDAAFFAPGVDPDQFVAPKKVDPLIEKERKARAPRGTGKKAPALPPEPLAEPSRNVLSIETPGLDAAADSEETQETSED